MGMFTSVYIPFKFKKKDIQLEIQFYTGDDMCDKYKVGDKVDWHINKDWWQAGALLDGIYTGGSYGWDDKKELRKDWWVVISKHRIVEVVEKEDYDEVDYNTQAERLKKKWKIRKWNKNWWTKKAYKRHLSWERKFKKERRDWEKKVDYKNKTLEQRFLLDTVRLVGRKLDYVGLARKFIISEKWPKGKAMVFDKDKKSK